MTFWWNVDRCTAGVANLGQSADIHSSFRCPLNSNEAAISSPHSCAISYGFDCFSSPLLFFLLTRRFLPKCLLSCSALTGWLTVNLALMPVGSETGCLCCWNLPEYETTPRCWVCFKESSPLSLSFLASKAWKSCSLCTSWNFSSPDSSKPSSSPQNSSKAESGW